MVPNAFITSKMRKKKTFGIFIDCGDYLLIALWSNIWTYKSVQKN